MPWASFLRADFDGIRQSMWDVPRSKRLALDGAVYGVFALFFYLQSKYQGAYIACAICTFSCVLTAIYVNVCDGVPRYVRAALNLPVWLAVTYYLYMNV